MILHPLIDEWRAYPLPKSIFTSRVFFSPHIRMLTDHKSQTSDSLEIPGHTRVQTDLH